MLNPDCFLGHVADPGLPDLTVLHSVIGTTQVISNASVLTAAAITGLDMSRFGEVVSIPFWDDTWRPESFYDKICANLRHGLHTLCLLGEITRTTSGTVVKRRAY